MHLRRRKTEIPVARKRLRCRQRSVSEVNRGDGKTDISAENQSREWEGQTSIDSEAGYESRHEEFVGHGIYYAADDGLEVPSASYPSVKEVGKAGVNEE